MQLANKYNNLNIAVKASLWFAICNILQKGISLITVPIFTRILTIEQYGTYNLYISWFQILTVVTTLNLSYGVFNTALVRFSEDRNRYIASMQGLTVCLVASFSAVYFVFQGRFNQWFGLTTVMMVMMFLELLLTPALLFWSGAKRFSYQYKAIVIVTLIKSILNPFLGVVAVYVSAQKVEARIFSTLVVEFLICGSIMVLQFYKGKCFFDKKYWHYALGFNIPLIPHYLAGSILTQGDRIIIEKLDSASSLAKYSVAYNVSMLTQLVTNAIVQAITPWLYTCLKEKEYQAINKKIRLILVMAASFVCALMLFAPEIIRIFATAEYYDAIYVIPPVAASVYFIFAYHIYSNIEFFFEKKSLIAVSSFVAAALNVVLNLIFIPVFGYIAAAYTTLLCYILYAVLHLWFCQRIIAQNAEAPGAFRLTEFYLIAAVVLLFTGCVNVVYDSFVIRYAVILIGVVACGIFHKKILQLAKTLL